MMHPSSSCARVSALQPVALACALLFACATHAQAQTSHAAATAPQSAASNATIATAQPVTLWRYTPQEPERMGAALAAWRTRLAQEQAQDSLHIDERATQWRSRAEVAPQAAEQAALLAALPAGAPELLRNWLASLPATGRVPLPLADARALELHPQLEPVLQTGDTLLLAARREQITVLRADGSSCLVPYVPQAPLAHYVAQCGVHDADTVFVAQTDGQAQAVPIAHWNAQNQAAPAAGDWIFAPSRGSGWSDALGLHLAQWLATQGVQLTPPSAPDAGVLASATLLPQAAQAPQVPEAAQTHYPAQPRALPVSSNDWGMVGLLQTPTARMRPQGSVSVTATRIVPFTHYNVSLQPYDWVEGALRYSRIGWDRHTPGVQGTRSYVDKSIELKLRLLGETVHRPALAVGWRDPLGTSVFGGEYVVASKRWGNWDASLGLGWGYVGARGDVRNPLSVLGARFDTRQGLNIGQGGKPNVRTWFTGPAAVFGGVQWHTPLEPLTVKLEWEGNNYQHEFPTAYRFAQKTPLNVGLVWQQDGYALSVMAERGRVLGLSISISGDIAQAQPRRMRLQQQRVQGLVQQPQAVRNAPLPAGAAQAVARSQLPSRMAQIVADVEQATGWKVRSVAPVQQVWHIEIEGGGMHLAERLNAGNAVLHAAAGDAVTQFVWQFTRAGVPVQAVVVQRAPWAAQYQQLPTPSQHETLAHSALQLQPQRPEQLPSQQAGSTRLAEGLQVKTGWHFAQQFGGTDGYLYALNWGVNAQMPLWQGAWASGRAQWRLLDNYDRYQQRGYSDLPQVRTLVREYQTARRLQLPNLQFNQLLRLSDDWWALGYAGYLESMFAGVGGELLWRPARRNWALGLDMNRVRQREVTQGFGLRDYAVNTGHVSWYWRPQRGHLLVKAQVGQYLAGDRGVTLDVSREFGNGVRMGAWATKTNVSAAQFGEGSFDKGVYVSVPFDAFWGKWTDGNANFVWQPLLRDGGARLSRTQGLYHMTQMQDAHAWQTVSAATGPSSVPPMLTPQTPLPPQPPPASPAAASSTPSQ